MPHLTDKLVRSLKPGPRRVEVGDDEVPGFRARVGSNGVAFHLRYRNHAGEQRNPQIGRYPAMSVAAAREVARKWYAEARAGGDPSRTRQDERGAPTFGDTARRWLEEYATPKCKPSTARRYGELVELHLIPELGTTKLAAIARADVERAHRSIGRKPGRGGPAKGAANRALLCASAIFNWCEGQGLRALGSNPCRGVKRFDEAGKGHYYSAAELARIGAVLDAAERATRGMPDFFGPSTIAVIRLLMLTGARLSDATNLQWRAVDLDHARLDIADSKTGRSIRPIGRAAVSLLRDLKKHRSIASAYVCPSSSGGPLDPTRVDRAWRSIRKRAELPDGARLHDLRHTAGSMALEAGTPLATVAKMLGHKSVATTAKIYAHVLDTMQGPAIAKYDDALAGAMARGRAENEAARADVVEIRRTRSTRKR